MTAISPRPNGAKCDANAICPNGAHCNIDCDLPQRGAM